MILDGLIQYDNGAKFWYKDGKLHRDDGPAIEYFNGTKHWYKNGKMHRVDGPAYIGRYGQEWWVNDNRIYCKTNDEFLRLMKLKAFL